MTHRLTQISGELLLDFAHDLDPINILARCGQGGSQLGAVSHTFKTTMVNKG